MTANHSATTPLPPALYSIQYLPSHRRT